MTPETVKTSAVFGLVRRMGCSLILKWLEFYARSTGLDESETEKVHARLV